MVRLRKPWARQWSRFAHFQTGSGCINAASTVDISLTGSKFPATGLNYSFQRCDLRFSATDTRTVDIDISGTMGMYSLYHDGSNSNTALIVEGGSDFMVERYDAIRLRIGAASGHAYYKIITEEI